MCQRSAGRNGALLLQFAESFEVLAGRVRANVSNYTALFNVKSFVYERYFHVLRCKLTRHARKCVFDVATFGFAARSVRKYRWKSSFCIIFFWKA